jgi:hypothetical protein
MMLEAQSLLAKKTQKEKKLLDEINEIQQTLKLMHAQKVITFKIHNGKCKKEKLNIEK